jgi:hypothetical protein
MSPQAAAVPDDDEETVEAEILDGNMALTAIDRASIDMQVSTAKQYPRVVSKSIDEALELATYDEDTAAACFYAMPRKGKTIEGPSVRLAEIMAYSWGNLRVETDIVAINGTHVTAMGTAYDCQRNLGFRSRVQRRITDSRGVRYNEDMIGVTSNAAAAIAKRNAVFAVIPGPFVKKVYQAARQASIGKGGTTQQKRQASLDWFGKVGVSEEQVFEMLGVRGIEDIGPDELIKLRGLATAIKDGETTVEAIFTPSRHSEKTDELNEAIAGDDEGPKMSKDDPDNPAGAAARFLDLCDSQDMEPGEARELLAKILELESASKIRASHYEKALSDVESFVALYRGEHGQSDGLPLD